MADKKISELDNLLSIDGTGDFLVIVDGDAGATKKTSVDTLIGDKISAVELSVNNPRTSGFAADINTIGQGLNGTRWIKVDSPDTSWEQILISEGGAFSANIQLAESSGIVLPANTLGSTEGYMTVGDGETIGGNKIRDEKRAFVPNKTIEEAVATGFFLSSFKTPLALNDYIEVSNWLVADPYRESTSNPGFGAPLAQLSVIGSVSETTYYYPWTPFRCVTDRAEFTFSSVKAVYFENNISRIKHQFIGGLAFSFEYCNFPEGLESIGYSAFGVSTFRQPFNAPSTFKAMEYRAFKDCNVPSVTLNSGIQFIDYEAFLNNDISSLDLGPTIQLIGYNAFKDNNILGDLQIPDSLGLTPVPSGTGIVASRSGIEDGAFENNTNLEDVYANIDAAFFNSGALRNAGTGNLYVTSGNISSYGGTGVSWGTKTVAEWTNYPTIPN
jgi:hypothetical protein